MENLDPRILLIMILALFAACGGILWAVIKILFPFSVPYWWCVALLLALYFWGRSWVARGG